MACECPPEYQGCEQIGEFWTVTGQKICIYLCDDLSEYWVPCQ